MRSQVVAELFRPPPPGLYIKYSSPVNPVESRPLLIKKYGTYTKYPENTASAFRNSLDNIK